MLAKRVSRSAGLVLSIDLDPNPRQQGESCPLLMPLVQLFNRSGFCATWGLGDPARSQAAAQIVAASPDQELALLGDPTWAGPASSRAEFAQELALRVEAAQAHGFAVSSLAVYDRPLEDHHDLVMKTGLTAVRGTIDIEGRSKHPAQPHALHYGLWEFPGNVRLPSGRRWGDANRARRQLDRAIAMGGLCHVVVDVPRLHAAGGRGLLERFLRYAGRRRDAGQLRVTTLREIAAEKSAPRRNEPARSVLRAAG